MRKNTKFQIFALMAVSLILCVFGALCMCFAVIGEYENDIGHFTVDSLFAPAVYGCLAGGVIIAAVSRIVFRKLKAPDLSLPGGIIYSVASAAAGSVILFSTVLKIKDTFDAGTSLSFVTVLPWLLALASVAYFYLSALSKNEGRVSPVMSLLSFAPTLFCAVEVLLVYFDTAVAVNSPIKNFCQFIYLAYMLAFCAETALGLGRGKVLARYIATLCLSITIGGSLSVAAFVLTVTGSECTLFTGTDSIVKLTLFAYMCVRFTYVTRIAATEEIKTNKADNTDLSDGLYEETGTEQEEISNEE